MICTPGTPCENDKQCVTCVKKQCMRLRKLDNPQEYECPRVEDIMFTLGSGVDCCAGYTIEDHLGREE